MLDKLPDLLRPASQRNPSPAAAERDPFADSRIPQKDNPERRGKTICPSPSEVARPTLRE